MAGAGVEVREAEDFGFVGNVGAQGFGADAFEDLAVAFRDAYEEPKAQYTSASWGQYVLIQCEGNPKCTSSLGYLGMFMMRCFRRKNWNTKVKLTNSWRQRCQRLTLVITLPPHLLPSFFFGKLRTVIILMPKHIFLVFGYV